ncbi:hypothetical protein V8E51_013786 [Hyaloscypha variabilis]
MLQLPKSKPWVEFEKWSQANNEGLLTVLVGRTPNIICNDAWSASDLMEKRAKIYSSRQIKSCCCATGQYTTLVACRECVTSWSRG